MQKDLKTITGLFPYIESVIIWAILILGYAAFLIGALHTYPNGEDLWLSAAARDVGILQSIINLLANYDGRYSTNILHALNPLTINFIEGYKMLPIITILLLLFGIYKTSRIFIYFINRNTAFKFSLIVLLAFLVSIPLPSTSLYWAGGCFVYIYPFIFLLLFADRFLRYITSDDTQTKQFIITALLLVFGIGFNEMFLAVYALFAIWLTGAVIYDKRQVHKHLPLLIVCVSSILFFVAAPGANIRISENEESLNVDLVFKAAENLFIATSGMLSRPVFWALLIYALMLFDNHNFKYRITFDIKKGILTIVGILSLCFLMITVYHLAKRTLDYPIRIFSPITGILTVAFFIMVGKFGILLRSIFILTERTVYGVKVILLLVALTNLFQRDNNFSLLVSDYRSGKMSYFSETMQNRIAAFEECYKSTNAPKICQIDAMSDNYPTSLYTYPDSEENQSQSVWNKYHEGYFRLDKVVTHTDTTNRYKAINHFYE